MHDRFQLRPCLWAVERQLAHAVAVQGAIGIDIRIAKHRADRWHGRTIRACGGSGNLVGVYQCGTQCSEQIADGTFAAANASGQAQAQGRRLVVQHKPTHRLKGPRASIQTQ
ncbi:hypothetical protein D3C72_1561790 [compost metagenome]